MRASKVEMSAMAACIAAIFYGKKSLPKSGQLGLTTKPGTCTPCRPDVALASIEELRLFQNLFGIGNMYREQATVWRVRTVLGPAA